MLLVESSFHTLDFHKRTSRIEPAQGDPGKLHIVRLDVVSNNNGRTLVSAWQGPFSRLKLTVGTPSPHLSRFPLRNGIVIVIGQIYELIERFSSDMSEVYPTDHLGSGLSVREAVELLTQANGSFAAIVVQDKGDSDEFEDLPAATLISSSSPGLPIYYGSRSGRVIVSTSPQTISDSLGFARRINAERLADICIYQNLVDHQTFFKGVFRLHNDERLEIRRGQLKTRRLSPGSFVMKADPDPEDPIRLVLGRRLIRRAVRLRRPRDGEEPITLFLGGDINSRALMALARDCGLQNLQVLTIGSRSGGGAQKASLELADQLGYRCRCLNADELDFRGLLESFLRNCGHPPQNCEHLLLEAALQEISPAGGRLWTGEGGTIEGVPLPFIQINRARSRRPWLPPPSLTRLLLPLQDLLRLYTNQRLWLLSLDNFESLVVSLCPEQSLNSGRSVRRLLRYGEIHPDLVPQATPAVRHSIERWGAISWKNWIWLWGDVVFGGTLRSRSRLAELLGATYEAPFRDAALLAFSCGLMPSFPPHYLFSRSWKKLAFEKWLPARGRRVRGEAVADLSLWFRETNKLGEYLDIVNSRPCLERGIFDASEVRRLLENRRDLSAEDARLLWMVLTTELLFQMEVVTSGIGALAGGVG